MGQVALLVPVGRKVLMVILGRVVLLVIIGRVVLLVIIGRVALLVWWNVFNITITGEERTVLITHRVTNREACWIEWCCVSFESRQVLAMAASRNSSACWCAFLVTHEREEPRRV